MHKTSASPTIVMSEMLYAVIQGTLNVHKEGASQEEADKEGKKKEPPSWGKPMVPVEFSVWKRLEGLSIGSWVT